MILDPRPFPIIDKLRQAQKYLFCVSASSGWLPAVSIVVSLAQSLEVNRSQSQTDESGQNTPYSGPGDGVLAREVNPNGYKTF